MCGTVSSWATPNYFGVQATFANINSNAEAHFGGPDIGGNTLKPTATATNTQMSIIGSDTFTYTFTETASGTFYTDISGSTIDGTVLQSTGTIISLTTPFVYRPARGANGAPNLEAGCTQSDGTENFGYVPQTLLDFIIADRNYAAQYPGLENCLPGGPSILPVSYSCETLDDETFQSAPGGDLTDSTVITVTPTIVGQAQSDSAKVLGILQSVTANNPPPPSTPPPPPPLTSPPPPPSNSIGAIINSIGGFSVQQGGQGALPSLITPPPGQAVTISGPTTIPVAQLPPGAQGDTTLIGGTPFVIISSATTLAIRPTQPIPASLGSLTVIGGTSFFAIPSTITVPAAGLPPGLGSTTLINGTPFVIIPSTTIALPANPTGQSFSTTIVNGMPFLSIPGSVAAPLQVSAAGRGRMNWIGFEVRLVVGFWGRFR
jgi:hypothetical protein